MGYWKYCYASILSVYKQQHTFMQVYYYLVAMPNSFTMQPLYTIYIHSFVPPYNFFKNDKNDHEYIKILLKRKRKKSYFNSDAALRMRAIMSPIFLFLYPHISFLNFENLLKLKGISCKLRQMGLLKNLKIRMTINFGPDSHTVFLGET